VRCHFLRNQLGVSMIFLAIFERFHTFSYGLSRVATIAGSATCSLHPPGEITRKRIGSWCVQKREGSHRGRPDKTGPLDKTSNWTKPPIINTNFLRGAARSPGLAIPQRPSWSPSQKLSGDFPPTPTVTCDDHLLGLATSAPAPTTSSGGTNS